MASPPKRKALPKGRRFRAGLFRCEVENVGDTYKLVVKDPGGRRVVVGRGDSVNAARQDAIEKTKNKGVRLSLIGLHFPEF
jgi:hypothetical protein